MADDLIIRIPKSLAQLSLLDDEDSLLVTCDICFEPVMFPNKQFQNSNRCIHRFCTDCVIRYIQTKLEDNVSDIKCPCTTCAHSLDPLSCRPIVSNRLFTRWCDALCESTALGFEGVYCPNNECSELIMNEFGDGNVKRCVCPACTKPFCFQCKVPWHDGYTCEETRDGNNVDFAVVCEKNGWNWKRCPKCGHCIEIDLYCYRVGCWILKCRFVLLNYFF
uniref:E3 ubiquitin-protein ligase RNF144A-like n=1 Tax=Erigeron canadensis TaxID=72917 RepID=UPI001CB93D2D|nr:E3 ubiquitin-protein ligase RNF144A-like [Erigeron canadensis]